MRRRSRVNATMPPYAFQRSRSCPRSFRKRWDVMWCPPDSPIEDSRMESDVDSDATQRYADQRVIFH